MRIYLDNKKGLVIDDEYHHNQKGPHRKEWNLSEIILGGQDGLVNVLGVILGVAAATSDVRVVMVAGLAATFAVSISMGAVAYTSLVAKFEEITMNKVSQATYWKELLIRLQQMKMYGWLL